MWLTWYLSNPLKQYQPISRTFIEHASIPQDALIVTLDVTNLYLNIPQTEGIQRVLNYHFQRFPNTNKYKSNMKSLMRIILEHNIFEFADRMYRQTDMRYSIGHRFAPSLANIFTATIEQEFLSGRRQGPLLWKRFIDDIFIIWTHGREVDASITALIKLKIHQQ